MMYIEKIIVRKIAEALLSREPFETITVDSERGFDPEAKRFKKPSGPAGCSAAVEAILAEADQFDECHIFVGGNRRDGYGPYVYLIFGNGNCGWDVISDYSTSLEATLKPVLEFIEKEAD